MDNAVSLIEHHLLSYVPLEVIKGVEVFATRNGVL